MEKLKTLILTTTLLTLFPSCASYKYISIEPCLPKETKNEMTKSVTDSLYKQEPPQYHDADYIKLKFNVWEF